MAKGKVSAREHVLVEMRVQKGMPAHHARHKAASLDTHGFKADPQYHPVPVRPAPHHAEMLAEADHHPVLARGTIHPDRIEHLKSHSDVMRVWRDTKIAPFPARAAARAHAPA